MSDTLTLRTTLSQFEGLHERIDKTRSTSKTVTVDRAALANLLMDHPAMIRKLIDRSIQVNTHEDGNLIARI
jgi:hypothetical protein